MSVEKMKLATISGDFDRLDEALALCVDSGCFQIENAAEHMTSLGGFDRLNDENPYRSALDTIISLAESFNIKPVYEKTDRSDENIEGYIAEIRDTAAQYEDLTLEKNTLLKEIDDLNSAVDSFEHFDKLDVPVDDLFECQFVKVRFGTLSTEAYNMLETFQRDYKFEFYRFSVDKDFCFGMYLTPRSQAEKVDLLFAGLFFERLIVPGATSTPSEAIAGFKKSIAEKTARIEEIDKTIADEVAARRPQLKIAYSVLLEKSRICELRKMAIRHFGSFIIIGFVPLKEFQKFSDSLCSIPSVKVGCTDTKNLKRLTPPTKLKNNPLARPFEFYIKMFGVPKYGEIDPTFFVAITYTILYGIMFADVGQGLVLSVIGFLMYKLKKMELGKLLIPCGISGAFFGLVFGSVFGFEHALDGMYRSLFKLDGKPIAVMDNMLTVLFSAVGIGVILVLIAMLLNIYSCLKQKNIGQALFSTNGLCGFTIYSGIVLIAANLILKWGLNTTALVVGMIVVPLVFLWFGEPLAKLVNREKDWKPESWGGYMVQGIFELFESVISYLTNTVSFLRVGAFVLVHASMMEVFFTLAEMAGQGSIGYYALIILGNIFVLVLEGLLVGVQSLRLEFYEMFNRFFEGSGREFNPIKY